MFFRRSAAVCICVWNRDREMEIEMCKRKRETGQGTDRRRGMGGVLAKPGHNPKHVQSYSKRVQMFIFATIHIENRYMHRKGERIYWFEYRSVALRYEQLPLLSFSMRAALAPSPLPSLPFSTSCSPTFQSLCPSTLSPSAGNHFHSKCFVDGSTECHRLQIKCILLYTVIKCNDHIIYVKYSVHSMLVGRHARIIADVIAAGEN